jgi:hypothetical protein
LEVSLIRMVFFFIIKDLKKLRGKTLRNKGSCMKQNSYIYKKRKLNSFRQ